jgi:hypothetical protein
LPVGCFFEHELVKQRSSTELLFWRRLMRCGI